MHVGRERNTEMTAGRVYNRTETRKEAVSVYVPSDEFASASGAGISSGNRRTFRLEAPHSHHRKAPLPTDPLDSDPQLIAGFKPEVLADVFRYCYLSSLSLSRSTG